MKSTETPSRVALLWLAVTLVCSLLPVRASAAAESTGFAGTVTDLATDAPVAGALIGAGGATAVSDAYGRYALPLPPGTYHVRAEFPGYIGMTQRYRRAGDTAPATLDFAMVPEHPTEAQAAVIEARTVGLHEVPDPAEIGIAARLDLSAAAVTAVPETLRVLMPDGSVQPMPLDEYLKGVLPNEMPPHWPREALRAQAIAARSFAVTRHAHADVGADVCTTSHCQAWSPTSYDTTDRAVDSTSGATIRYDGAIAHGFYFARCDGHTRNSEDVWGGYLPYARSVECAHQGDSLRGHGVGMCQYGARLLAEQGVGYADILRHYYTGTEVVSATAQRVTNAGVSPAAGDRGTLFAFEATYIGASDRPPAVANVVIDGLAHSLLPVAGDPSEGRLYRYETYLTPGVHTYRFYFDDGHGQVVRVPGSGDLSGPTVQPDGVTPTAVPTTGTLAGSITHSTAEDWGPGTFDGVQASPHGDGALTLQAGREAGTYTSTPLQAPLEFMAVGVNWYAQAPGGADVSLAVRTSTDGQTWTPWRAVTPDEDMDVGPVESSDLIFGEGRFLQYRATLRTGAHAEQPVLENVRFACMDTSDGPLAVDLAGGVHATASMPPVISRAGWGANEAYMTADPEYRTVQAVVIHHTATNDGGTDPAAMVRAVYYYHAVVREWGDIGYNYLIDKYGNIYEGRYGGKGVVGHHAGWYNYGSVGISLIGNFEEEPVPQAMLTSLTNLLAALCTEHWLNPLGEGFFIDRVLPVIFAHRDVSATTCPGRFAYALLPQIRGDTAAKSSTQVPRVDLVSPRDGQAISGVVPVTVRDNVAIASVEYHVDGVHRATVGQSPFVWRWNTTTAGDGQHTIRVVARNPGGAAETTVTVRVDNAPPTGTVTAPKWVSSAHVPFSVQAQGATAVRFSNGWVWEGEDLQHAEGSGERVADAAALNGTAWQGRSGHAAGAWFGPYTLELPAPQAYRVYFRLKTPQCTLNSTLGRLDVADNLGYRIYVERQVTADDFAADNTYQEFGLDLQYAGTAPTWEDGQSNGLEFRTWFYAAGDLTLDRVSAFGPALAVSPQVYWTIRPVEGPQVVTARLLDEAGNFLDVAVTVSVDLTEPKLVERTLEAARVRDTDSGLDTRTAQYTFSTDKGFSWSPWRRVALTQAVGTKEVVTLRAPAEAGTYVRFRIADVAGNTLDISPFAPVPQPRPTLPPGHRISPVFPLIFKGWTP